MDIFAIAVDMVVHSLGMEVEVVTQPRPLLSMSIRQFPGLGPLAVAIHHDFGSTSAVAVALDNRMIFAVAMAEPVEGLL